MGYTSIFDVRDTIPELEGLLRRGCLGVLVSSLAVLACLIALGWRSRGQQNARAFRVLGALVVVVAAGSVLGIGAVYFFSIPRQELTWLASGDYRTTEAEVTEVFVEGHTSKGGPVEWFGAAGQQFRSPALPAGERLHAGDRVRVTHRGNRLLRLERANGGAATPAE
jgi:hypothetical protein